jgi:hypothetical protein
LSKPPTGSGLINTRSIEGTFQQVFTDRLPRNKLAVVKHFTLANNNSYCDTTTFWLKISIAEPVRQ